MLVKLTEQFIKTLKPETSPYEVNDESLKGLLLRVQPSGVMTFYATYRNKEKNRQRIKLGQYGQITLSQARDLAKKHYGAIATGLDPQFEKKKVAEAIKEKESKAITLRSFIDETYKPWVMVNRKSSEHTLMLLDAYFQELMEMPMSSLTLQHVEAWQIAQAKRGLKPSAINRPLNALRAVYTRAVDLKVLTESPLKDLQKVPECQDVRVRYLSEEESQKLRAALLVRNQKLIAQRASGNEWRSNRGYELMPDLQEHHFGDYLMPMVLLGVNTGLRRGELFQMRWEDIDFEKRMLTVRAENAKSSKTRRVPLNDEAYQVLNAWKETSYVENGLVFPGQKGKPIVTVQTAWDNLMEAAGIKDFRFHDIRHDFASKLVMKGVDLNLVRELLGHADYATTLRYAHVGDTAKTDAVNRL